MAKIFEHIDGTSGAERGCNMDWTLDRNVIEREIKREKVQMKPPFFWFLNLLDRNVIESEIKREKVQRKPPYVAEI